MTTNTETSSDKTKSKAERTAEIVGNGPLTALIDKLSPEQRAAIEAMSTEQDEEEPIVSLSQLKASSRIWVPVWEDHPNRLKVGYLPVIAADPRVMTQMTRIMGRAVDLQNFAVDLQRKGQDLQDKVKEATDAGTEINVRLGDVLDQDQFEALITDFSEGMATYLTTVCSGWTLKEPFTRETLLGPDAGMAVMQPIFGAIRRYDTTKNGSGSASIITS
jgi:hypothetical protein